jgi:hypothetical protein
MTDISSDREASAATRINVALSILLLLGMASFGAVSDRPSALDHAPDECAPVSTSGGPDCLK